MVIDATYSNSVEIPAFNTGLKTSFTLGGNSYTEDAYMCSKNCFFQLFGWSADNASYIISTLLEETEISDEDYTTGDSRINMPSDQIIIYTATGLNSAINYFNTYQYLVNFRVND